MPTEYNENFFELHREGSYKAAQKIVPLVLELMQPRSVIDVGCGSGSWLRVFKDHGISDVLGIDGDYVERNLLEIPEDQFLPFDLTDPLEIDRKFDLVISLEVAEHLSPKHADNFVSFLTKLGPVVLFSAAIPFQGGTTHLNEQWPEYWVEHFERKGYVVIDPIRKSIWQNDNIEVWYLQNILMFIKRDFLKKNKTLRPTLKTTTRSQLSIVHPRLFLEVAMKNELHKENAESYIAETEKYKEEAKAHREKTEFYITESEKCKAEIQAHKEKAEYYIAEAEKYKAEAEVHREKSEFYIAEAQAYKEKAEFFITEIAKYKAEAKTHREKAEFYIAETEKYRVEIQVHKEKAEYYNAEAENYKFEANAHKEKAEFYIAETEKYRVEMQAHKEKAEYYIAEAENYKFEANAHKEKVEFYIAETEKYRVEMQAHKEKAEYYIAEAEKYKEETRELKQKIEICFAEVERHKVAAEPRNMSLKKVLKALPTIIICTIRRK